MTQVYGLCRLSKTAEYAVLACKIFMEWFIHMPLLIYRGVFNT